MKDTRYRSSWKARGIILSLLLMLTFNMYGQEIQVRGKVISSEDNLGIPGVSVVIKGKTVGTITDIDGIYSINATKGETLVFSFMGMETLEQVITSANIDVALQAQSFNINEIVAIGYGTQRKKEVSGAVVQVKSEQLTKMATSDLGSALQGQVAGVSVQASSGAPGAAANIQIRGLSSVNGANAPLFVVDGIPQDGDPRLSNNEIETIDILKDAASASIYGTRGSGGVVLITTKQGKKGQMRIALDSYMGVQKITSGIELMNFDEYWYNSLTQTQTIKGTTTDGIWTELETSKDDFTNNTNLMGTIQNDNAVIQNHSLNISGGTKDLTYSLVGSFFKQDGVLINSGYERYNVRSNTTFKKNKWTIRSGLGFRVEEQSDVPWNFLYDAYKYKPYAAPIDPSQDISVASGGKDSNDAMNLGNMMSKFKQSNVRNGEQFNANIDLNYEILKNFNLTTRAGVSFNNNTRIEIKPKFEVYTDEGELVVNTNTRSSVKNTSDRATSFTWESGLNYMKELGDHKIKLLGVFSTEKYTYTRFYGEKKDLFSNEVTVLNGASSEPNAGSGITQWERDRTNTLVGMLGRVQYDYKGRYILSASVRRDGSSRFGEENRWGTFPSASVAWNVADENFWSPLADVANSLKIRASYGTTGNQNFADYAFAPTISLNYDYPFGAEGDGMLAIGAIQTAYSNEDVKWETTVQQNVGFDLGMFNNKMTFTADFYNSDKKDMLFPLLIPTSGGAGEGKTVVLNVGDMNNKGMEFALGYRHSGKLSWSVNATYSKNVNEITKMSGSADIAYFTEGYALNEPSNRDKITALKEGYAAGSFFVMKTNGIVNTEAKLANYQKIDPEAKMGDLIYVDSNGNGKIEEGDRVYGGSGAPEYELGLNASVDYKGFDLAMVWFASVGNEVVNGSRAYAMISGTHKDLLYQHTIKNPYGVIPTNRGSGHMNYRGWSDMWIEDGSFVRLRNITLGYSLPKSMLTRLKLSKLRVYAAADNPLTLTKYQGYDPEVGGNGLATRGLDRGNYPVSAQYRMGIQLDF
ncbi:TonB-dependent receptor [Labilibaculum sp. DW002]|uniref:TonB-dependent receptor n=1 Tax=Paralabilibaculum antarcticum TaxID=2912572 RepID=A0ABT5VQ24_9BACT|nr:TonB-dependent receptor [Labilibaculum sp. DW002]MDE5417536.1 TonB-dependent receptor [Labilibaculum sp. DW002]